MQAARVVITVADSATKAVEDQAIEIETYGNASAQHEFDLDTPTVNPGAGGIVAASFGANAIDSSALATSAANEIRDAVVAFLSGRQNTAAGGGGSTITLDAGAVATNDFYTGMMVLLTGGTGAGQARLITSYVGATKVATVGEAWATNPDNTSVFTLLPNRAMVSKMLTDVLDANALAASAVAEIQTGLATSAALAVVQADTDDIQTRLPAALTGGRMDSSVGAMAANVLTAAALAADAAAEIAAAVGSLTSAELAAIPGVGGTLQQKLDYIFEMMRHKITQTAVTQTLFKDNGVTPLGTGAVSDDGVTFTRGKLT
jgi:hypothetical protein